jgi:hypothetical protein
VSTEVFFVTTCTWDRISIPLRLYACVLGIRSSSCKAIRLSLVLNAWSSNYIPLYEVYILILRDVLWRLFNDEWGWVTLARDTVVARFKTVFRHSAWNSRRACLKPHDGRKQTEILSRNLWPKRAVITTVSCSVYRVFRNYRLRISTCDSMNMSQRCPVIKFQPAGNAREKRDWNWMRRGNTAGVPPPTVASTGTLSVEFSSEMSSRNRLIYRRKCSNTLYTPYFISRLVNTMGAGIAKSV